MLLDDTAEYLETNSTRLTVGADLHKGFLPETTGKNSTALQAALYETGGLGPLHYFSTTTGFDTRKYERPGLQALVRAKDYQFARAAVEDIYTVLDGVANTNLPTATGPEYVQIDAVQSPFLIERDSNDRFVLGVNFLITKTTG